MLAPMNISTPLLALVAAAAGVAGAITTVVLVDDGPTSTATLEPVQPLVDEAAMRALRTRLEFVEQQNERFAERIQELEIASAEFGELDRAPRELEPVAAAAGVARGPDEVAPEMLVESVGEALETILAEQEAERDRERAERRAERTEDRLAELTEQLGLDSYQVDQMRDWMTTNDEARDALRDEIRESGDFNTAREMFDELRESGRKSLETFLMPQQIETFEELNAPPWERFGRGRGGPGGG